MEILGNITKRSCGLPRGSPAQLPLLEELRRALDGGCPVICMMPNSSLAQAHLAVVRGYETDADGRLIRLFIHESAGSTRPKAVDPLTFARNWSRAGREFPYPPVMFVAGDGSPPGSGSFHLAIHTPEGEPRRVCLVTREACDRAMGMWLQPPGHRAGLPAIAGRVQYLRQLLGSEEAGPGEARRVQALLLPLPAAECAATLQQLGPRLRRRLAQLLERHGLARPPGSG